MLPSIPNGAPMGGPPPAGNQGPPPGAPMEGEGGGAPSRDEVLMTLRNVIKKVRQFAAENGISMEEVMGEGGEGPTSAPPTPAGPPPLG